MSYTIFNIANGQILKTVSCSFDQLTLQYDPVIESYVDGSYSDSEYYFNSNVAVKKPDSPDINFTFNYSTKTWEDLRTLNQKWNIVRQKRDKLLGFSDWTQLSDVSLANKQAWTTYRQALRDITLQLDPLNIIWPTPPQG